MFLVAPRSNLLKICNPALLVCDRLLMLLLLACHASTCVCACILCVIPYQGPAATAAATANTLNSMNIVFTGPSSTLSWLKRFAATYALLRIG